MKKMLLNFADKMLSKDQMKKVKGGCTVYCTWTECWGGDCFNMSGACASSDAAACTWYVGSPGSTSVSNISCC